MGFVVRQTSEGRPYRVWVPERMPLLPPDNLAVCFYLYPSRESSERGDAKGGSGFFVGIPYSKRPGTRHHYAITNRHLIDNALGLPTVRVNKIGGGVDHIETQHDEWTGPHGRDFCVRRMGELQRRVHQWRQEDISILTDSVILANYGIGLGDDVFTIGRFMDRDGAARANVPIARFGNISLMQETSIDSGASPAEPGYLVEMRSRTGFSGSVVYVYMSPGGANLTQKPRSYQPGAWVLGLHSAQLLARGPAAEFVGDGPTPPSTSFATAITHVVPAYVIKDFILNDPRLVAEREAEEAAFEAAATFGELEDGGYWEMTISPPHTPPAPPSPSGEEH